ncbi:hypothetical protein PVAP13_6NG312537 [Panicum virgatum]|uniref:Uncharacterized protein n=1 Tax=Panicum virgatum TaxID=38727 RepID=A0A8T0R2V1_PANVG|nr:hypothetical protein PVAP13_6NG312537 [Panicum virgatum]
MSTASTASRRFLTRQPLLGFPPRPSSANPRPPPPPPRHPTIFARSALPLLPRTHRHCHASPRAHPAAPRRSHSHQLGASALARHDTGRHHAGARWPDTGTVRSRPHPAPAAVGLPALTPPIFGAFPTICFGPKPSPLAPCSLARHVSHWAFLLQRPATHPTRPHAPGCERKEPRGDAAATICGPHSLASGLAAGGDEERGSVSSTDHQSS